jgi:hypothetical protein
MAKANGGKTISASRRLKMQITSNLVYGVLYRIETSRIATRISEIEFILSNS